MLGLVGLWSKVVSGTGLPARCNKEWYFLTFCGVTKEQYHAEIEHLDVIADIDIAQHLQGSRPTADARVRTRRVQQPLPLPLPQLSALSHANAVLPVLQKLGNVKPYDVVCFMLNLGLSDRRSPRLSLTRASH